MALLARAGQCQSECSAVVSKNMLHHSLSVERLGIRFGIGKSELW